MEWTLLFSVYLIPLSISPSEQAQRYRERQRPWQAVHVLRPLQHGPGAEEDHGRPLERLSHGVMVRRTGPDALPLAHREARQVAASLPVHMSGAHSQGNFNDFAHRKFLYCSQIFDIHPCQRLCTSVCEYDRRRKSPFI